MGIGTAGISSQGRPLKFLDTFSPLPLLRARDALNWSPRAGNRRIVHFIKNVQLCPFLNGVFTLDQSAIGERDFPAHRDKPSEH
jgi:hypothetical protein